MRKFNENDSEIVFTAGSTIKDGSYVRLPAGKVEYILQKREIHIFGEKMNRFKRSRPKLRALKKGIKLATNGRRVRPTVKGTMLLTSRDSGVVSQVPVDSMLWVAKDKVIV